MLRNDLSMAMAIRRFHSEEEGPGLVRQQLERFNIILMRADFTHRMSIDDRKLRKNHIGIVKEITGQVFHKVPGCANPKVQLVVGGSHANRLSCKTSDLDLCIIIEDEDTKEVHQLDKETKAQLLQKLKTGLNLKKRHVAGVSFDGIAAIYNARVPILKMFKNPTRKHPYTFNVDISIGDGYHMMYVYIFCSCLLL